MKKLIAILTVLTLLTGFAAAQNSVQIEISKTNTEPTPLRTSEYADIWLEVRNNGEIEANNVQVEFLENYPFSADPDEQTEWDAGTLVPGEEYQIHLQTRVDENAVQGTNSLRFRTSSATGNSVTRGVPVEVRSDNDLLTVSDVDFPENVAPGSSNEMTLSIENLADGQIKNIQVDMDLSKIPLATSKTTSQAVTKIQSGEMENVSFSLNVDESAENGVYKIPLSMTYENEAGTEFTRKTTVGAVVGGAPDLQVGVNNEGQLTTGTQTVTFRIVNQGYGSAEFVELQLPEGENYRVLSSDSVYIGDMDSDDFQTAEFQIYLESSNVTLPTTLRYSDSTGDVSVTDEVELDIYSQKELQQYGLGEQGSIVPLVVILLLVAGGVLYWRRRRKKK